MPLRSVLIGLCGLSIACLSIASAEGGASAPRGVPRTRWPHVKGVNEVAVNLLSRPTTEEARERVMRDYDPDILDWTSGAYANAGRWFTMRGVRVAGGANECYFTEIHRSHPLLERLDGNGLFARPGGAYAFYGLYDILALCPNAPKTRGLSKQGILAYAMFVDAVCQDNFGLWATHCNCRWCGQQFRE